MALTRVQVHQVDVIGAGTNGLVLPSGNTSQRPASANLGTLRYNTDINELEEFNGVSWDTIADSTQHITIAGDVTGSGNIGNIISVTLSSVNSNVGTFGSTVSVPVITVNSKGLVTGVTTSNISVNGTSISQHQILSIASLRI